MKGADCEHNFTIVAPRRIGGEVWWWFLGNRESGQSSFDWLVVEVEMLSDRY
jgi:hypothetical protein